MKRILRREIVFISLLLYFGKLDAQRLDWAKDYASQNHGLSPTRINVNGNRIACAGLFGQSSSYPYAYKGIFLYTTDSIGNLLWGDTLYGSKASVTGLSVDSQGNVYFAATAVDSIWVDGGNISCKSFLIKYNPSGAKLATSTFSDAVINDVYALPDNQLVLLFTFKSLFSAFNQTYLPVKSSDLLLARLSPSGSLLRTDQFKGNAQGKKLQYTKNRILVFGSHFDTLTVGSHTTQIFNYEDDFVLSIDTLGGVFFTVYSCSGYFQGAFDFAADAAGKFAVTGNYSHHGATAILDIFSASGTKVEHGTSTYGNIPQCERNAKLAFADTSGLWSFHQEVHYIGHPAGPDSTWTNLALIKMSYNYELRLYEKIQLQGGPFTIAGNNRGAIYIASAIPPSQLLAIQHTTLINSNSQAAKLFIAKYYDNGNYVSISEQSHEKRNASIFPNPSNGAFFLRIPSNISLNKINIEIHTIMGSSVWKGDVSFSDGLAKIDMHTLLPGVYIVHLDLLRVPTLMVIK